MALTAYQAHMKRELKGGKMKGKTKSQRKAIFKAAAKSWKKKKSGSKSKSKPKSKSVARRPASKSKSTGGRSTVAKNGLSTQKLFKYMRIGALALPAASIAMGPGDVPHKLGMIKNDYFGVGFDGKFRWEALAKGWTPYVASILVTVGIPKIASFLRKL